MSFDYEGFEKICVCRYPVLSACGRFPVGDAPTAPEIFVTPTLLPDEPPPARAEFEFKTDFSKHNVPYSEILSGGPPKDGIPAICFHCGCQGVAEAKRTGHTGPSRKRCKGISNSNSDLARDCERYCRRRTTPGHLLPIVQYSYCIQTYSQWRGARL